MTPNHARMVRLSYLIMAPTTQKVLHQAGLFALLAPLLSSLGAVSYTHLRAHETRGNLVCRLLLEKKKQNSNFKKFHQN
ncbi:hypothetical protein AMBR_JPGBJEAN_02775 [Lacticaseibacillus rhamnosus]|nr:hypothetical protein AMBR_JPGBJEAN_02775 [Lacticaseibacillus rhamnosus]